LFLTHQIYPNVLPKELHIQVDILRLRHLMIQNEYFLGHDKAQYKIEETFLESNLLWCHAKNINALEKMLKNKKIHCFWHQNDDVTLTSKGFIWTYPNRELTKKSICVLPELNSFDMTDCYGVCSDYIQQYK